MSEPLPQLPLHSNHPTSGPSVPDPHITPEEFAEKNWKGTQRFRILIIGNANAGKTTILEKVRNAQGRKPEFLDADGRKVCPQIVASRSAQTLVLSSLD